MAILDKVPTNKNFLSPLNFNFFVRKAPHVNFFCQSTNIPGFGLVSVETPNPFLKIQEPGDSLEYQDLQCVFKIDEDLMNYLQLSAWIKGLGFPNDWSEYKALKDKPRSTEMGLKSDILVQILDSNKIPKFNVNFHDAFPLNVGNFQLTTTATDVTFVTVTAVFKYTGFDVEVV